MKRSKPIRAMEWPADSIQARYLSEVRPVLTGKAQLAIANACDAALRHFAAFAKGPTPAEDVTNAMVEEFQGWLMGRMKAIMATRCGERVRYVVRRLGLEGCPSMRTPLKRPPNPTPGTIWHFFETHYRPQRLMDAKPCSIEQFRVCFNRLERQHGRELLIEELTSEAITGHMAWALDFNAMAPASVNSIRRKLLAIAREAYAVKLLADLPRVKRLREPIEEPTAWNLEEIDAILRTCRQQQGIITGSRLPAAEWWTCIILLALNTGLRRRALLALKRDDVDLKESIVRVPAAAMKNARGKSYKLCPPVMEAIRAIWLPAREKLLPWNVRRECLQRKYTAILIEAGLPATRRDKFHKLRRTTATTIAAAVGLTKAQEYLGHQSIATTQRYVDPTKLPESDLSGHLERLVSGPKPKLHAAKGGAA